MEFSEEDIQEFRTEAEELLDAAEKSLLALDKGEAFKLHYDAIFRAFHSIKGAAGMMEMTPLQKHMHELENTLTLQKSNEVLEKQYIDLFLRGSDGARNLLAGKPIEEPSAVEAGSPQPITIKEEYLETKKESIKTKSESKGGKILVVDDEPEIVDLLVDIFRSVPLEVMGTTHPKEVLGLINTFRPDAILTDISMPEMDGLQLAIEIFKTHPDIPVIFVSGHVTKEAVLDAIERGIYAIIEKPFDEVNVMAVGLNAIRKHQLTKVLNSSINLILYQFSDLDSFLKSAGKEDIRNTIKFDLTLLVNQWRELRGIKR